VTKALIIGAGPAGLSAAYYGVRKDIRVVVYEADSRDKVPSKPCGEAIPKFVFDYLPKDIEKDFILNHIKRAIFYFNGEFIREFKNMPLLEGFIIDKRKLLLNLAELATSMGAKIIWGNPLRVNEVLKMMDTYDYVIDATGLGIIARKFLDYKNYKLIPVLQAYARGDTLPDDTIVMWGVDRGYAWVFPRGDKYNIGVGGVYKDSRELHKILKQVISHFKLDLVSPIRGSAVSVNGPLKKLVRGKLRVVGEAGGMVMPTTGEGIRFAIAAGKMVFEENYEKIFWKTFGWKLKNGVKLLNLLLKLKNKAKLARIAKDDTYFAFFEGIYDLRKILSVGIKYVLTRG